MGGSPGLGLRLALALLVALGGLALDRLGGELAPLRRLELLTLDWRFQLRGPKAPPPEILLVMIDDRSVARLGRWPAPRGRMADAVRLLALGGAEVIALNLLLAEATQILPAQAEAALRRLLDTLPPTAGAARTQVEAVLALDDADLDLGTAISAAGRVVLPYAFVFDPRAATLAGTPPWLQAAAYGSYLRPAGSEGLRLHAEGLITPAAHLAGVGAGQGHVTLLLDEDGSLRFDLPAFSYGDAYYPSLAVESARLFLRVPHERTLLRLGEGLALGEVWVPTDERSRLLVNHYGPEGSIETVSFIDLVEGRIPPERLRGRLAVIGASAAATGGDRFATPFDRQLPGSEHVATAIGNILHGQALRRDGEVRLLDALAVLALALLGSLLAGRRSYLLSLAVALTIAAGWSLIAAWAFAADLWLSVVVPVLAGLLAVTLVEASRIAHEQRRRRHLERQRANLARYFPPPVVDRLALGNAASKLERTQDAAVMFVDMVGFTRASESLSPAEAMALLRSFHARVERAVFAHGGMLDKFIGDGALACFGVPDPSPRACTEALLAARTLLAELGVWNLELEPQGRPPMRAAIGLHWGPVLMGDIGGERQFQFTVVGDTVNVASRLEALTRQHDTAVLASAALIEAAQAEAGPAAFAGFEPVADLAIRGRGGLVSAWRLPPLATGA